MPSRSGSERPPVTTTPQSNSAADRFFDIPELVDHTLFFLPPADVIRARQLNSYFNARVLAATKELRRHLFLTPKAPAGFDQIKVYLQNFCFRSAPEQPAFFSIDAPKIRCLHPVLGDALPANPFTVLPNGGIGTLCVQDVLDWKSGPWQQMLLTQPPCQFVRCLCYSRQAAGRENHEVNGVDFRLGHGQVGVTVAANLANTDGVTLGDLRKKLESLAEENNSSRSSYQLVQLCLRTFPAPVSSWDRDIRCYQRIIWAGHDPLGTSAEIIVGIPWQRIGVQQSSKSSSERTQAHIGKAEETVE